MVLMCKTFREALENFIEEKIGALALDA